jgi:hypothetical protein
MDDKEIDNSWVGAEVQCDICNHIWIAVFDMNLDYLECPNCHNMVNYEILGDEDS